jgi:succinate dehydrogenase / fumarate reductase cytochrome b subunit
METQEKKTRDRRQGVMGWLAGGRYGLERRLYILQRLTGLGLIFYLPIHVWVTAQRVQGEEIWESTMESVHGPIFTLGEYILFVAFAFHAMNGLRLALTELGFFIGQPERPVYPHVTSVGRQRWLVWTLMAIVAIAIIVAGYDFFLA